MIGIVLTVVGVRHALPVLLLKVVLTDSLGDDGVLCFWKLDSMQLMHSFEVFKPCPSLLVSSAI